MTIRLEVLAGPMRGKVFEVDRHDTFLFGRGSDCHFSLPEDPYVSRHHFILEANPPVCVIRDLGSRSGVLINENRLVRKSEDVEKSTSEEAYVGHNDILRVGKTEIRLIVDHTAICDVCRKSFTPEDQVAGHWTRGAFLCRLCLQDESGTVADETETLLRDATDATRDGVPATLAFSREGISDLPETFQGFPGYEAIELIGQGPYSRVYLSRDIETGREVALKLLRTRPGRVQAQAVRRFQREMDICMALDHRNIVRCEKRGRDGRLFFFVMQLCPDGSVDDVMRRGEGKLGVEESVTILLQVLEGVKHAHEQKVVHRDIKPANILLERHTLGLTARVSDFGLAKNFLRAGLSDITLSGTFGGSWPFMPKEQVISFKYSRPVSDVFGAGASLYNMITGEYVYDFVGARDYIRVILEGKMVPVRERAPSLPRRIAEVIDCATDPDPAKRYATAAAFKDALMRAT